MMKFCYQFDTQEDAQEFVRIVVTHYGRFVDTRNLSLAQVTVENPGLDDMRFLESLNAFVESLGSHGWLLGKTTIH